MALVDLFFDRRPKLGHLVFDASMDETHEEATEYSPYPVEVGFDRDDHARDEPSRVSMELVQSNTVAKIGYQLRPDFDPVRHITAWDDLVELKERHEPFILVTSLHTYSNMVIESLVAHRSFEDTDVLRVQVSMRRFETAFTTFAAAKVADELADAAEDLANVGAQGAAAAEAADAAAAMEAIAA